MASDPSRAAASVSPLDDALYRLMIDSVTDYAILLLDPHGHIRSWNLGAKRIKGYEASEIIGQHFSIFYPPDVVAQRWPEHELQMAQIDGRFEDEGWRIRKDGSRFWANIILTRLLDPQGQLVGFSKITRDLSEARQQQEMLRLSEERFRLLVEGVKDYAIFMLEPDGKIASWNDGAQMNKGYEAHEIIGKHFSKFYPPEVAASGWPDQELELALRHGSFEDEGWRVRKDGSRFWASVIITALKDDQGRHRGFAKITRDLTEKRRIRTLEDEGRRITTFLAMLGHELRNPLAPISNALAVIEREQIESPTLSMMREIIARQLKQMTRLVDDLLDVSRITSGKILLESKPVNLRNAILEAVEAFEPLARNNGVALRSQLTEAPLWISGDRARIVQIVANLLSNAVKFTPASGLIEVTLTALSNTAEISVKDNGSGIAPSVLPNIFGLFVQGEQKLDRAHGGLGLGLSLVHQLVSLHGGDVAATSAGQAGLGSEFTVTLPLIDPPLIRAVVNTPLTEAPPRRILVVDDNRDAASTLGLLLQSMGYKTEVVYDGLSAIESIRQRAFEVVLLDIGLPGLNGYEVAQRIQREIAEPPTLIAITGYGQEKDREISLQAGFHSHLIKPLDIGQLTTLLKKLFE